MPDRVLHLLHRRRLPGVGLLLVLAAAGAFLWARAALHSEALRLSIAGQLTNALGRPVSISAVTVTVFPRPAVRLTGVSIGAQSEARVAAIGVSASPRALLSGRIAHARLQVDGATINLPLPPPSVREAEPDSRPRLEITSVDDIVLRDIRLISRGRTLRGEIDIEPHGTTAATIHRVALAADGALITGHGELTSLAGPVGAMEITAGALDIDRLTTFATAFTAEAPTASAGGADVPSLFNARGLDLVVRLVTDRAALGGAALQHISGTAHLRDAAVELAPLTFDLFGGRYAGRLSVLIGREQTFTWNASLTGVEIGKLVAFAGRPDMLTGRMRGDIALTGQGTDWGTALRTVRGTARIAVTDGVVKNLALARTAVDFASEAGQRLEAGPPGRDEPFTEFAATLLLNDGKAATHDLHFFSGAVQMEAAGSLALDGSAIDLTGEVHLSQELSRQIGSRMAHLSARDGRITVPVSVAGSVDRYVVAVDKGTLLRRAATGGVLKGLGKIVGR